MTSTYYDDCAPQYSGLGADYTQDTDEVVDYPFDWSGRLDGDAIATCTFVLPDGGTSVSESNNTVAATIFVSFGNSGTFRITNRITTTGGRTWEKTIRVAVTES